MKSIKLLTSIIIICIILLIISNTISTQIINNETNYLIETLSTINSDIIIPDDYPTIQDGIINANTGDKIFVRNGLYQENIIINKEKN